MYYQKLDSWDSSPPGLPHALKHHPCENRLAVAQRVGGKSLPDVSSSAAMFAPWLAFSTTAPR